MRHPLQMRACGRHISALVKRGPDNRISRLSDCHPSYGPSDFQFRDAAPRKLFLSGLRLAAGETT